MEVLVEQGRTRLTELLPIRYGRMAASPFAFFRGAAAVMVADLAAARPVGIEVQLCGDAHLSNFGTFGTPERRLVFDINDFDETARGPFEWDVQRLAASLEIAGRERDFSTKQRAASVRAATRGYGHTMGELAAMGNLDAWYTSLDIEQVLTRRRDRGRRRGLLDRAVTRARAKDNRHAYARLVHDTSDGPRFAPAPPLVVPIEDLADRARLAGMTGEVAAILDRYVQTLSPDRAELLRSYRVVHMARKVVGVGSVGTHCWIVLLLGRDAHDPLVLQVKQAGESVVARATGPSPYANDGERVVAGQKMMQAAGDAFLGWDRVDEGLDGQARDFYVRQLRDWKGSVNVTSLTPTTMRRYAALCGQALARAHARTGDRIALAGYLGTGDAFGDAMIRFAGTYADQNERDLGALRSAIDAGRLEAVTGA